MISRRSFLMSGVALTALPAQATPSLASGVHADVLQIAYFGGVGSQPRCPEGMGWKGWNVQDTSAVTPQGIFDPA